MRSGGPRMLCSPYFVIVLFILVVFISMKYYSISTENDTLMMRIEVLQNQMKMTGSNLKSLDTSLTQKNEDLMECNNQRIRAEEKVKNLQQEREDKDSLVNRLKDDISTKQKTLEKLQTENVNLYVANDSITDAIQKLNEEVGFLKVKNERLEKHRTECLGFEEKIIDLEEELKIAKEELVNFGAGQVEGKDKIAIQGSGGSGNKPELKNGELPDVDPNAVDVRQPAMIGNTYHKDSKGNFLPILPRGDPNGPRPAPRFSVAGSNPSQKNESDDESKKSKRDQSPLNMTKVDSNTILEHQLKPAKNKTFQHKTSKNETFEHKTAKSKPVKTLHNKTLETTKSSNEIREQFSNIEEGGGAAAEHGPDVHIKPVQHEAKEENDGEELRDKAQDIPDIKNDSMNNLEKDLEKEEAGENDDGIEIEDIAIKGRDNQQQQQQSKDAGDHEDDARIDEEVKDKEDEEADQIPPQMKME